MNENLEDIEELIIDNKKDYDLKVYDSKRRSKSPIYLLFILLILSGCIFMYIKNNEKKDDKKDSNETSSISFTKEELPRIDASVSLHKLTEELIIKFTGNGTYYNDIVLTDKYTAFKKLVSNDVDILLTSKPGDDIIEYGKKYNIEYDLTEFSYDGLVFFVNKDNSVENVTSLQLSNIYSGVINNWNLLGGVNSNIIVLQDINNKDLYNYLKTINNKLKVATKEELSDNFINSINYYTNSIGYAYYSDIKDNKDIKILSIDGVKPSDSTIEDGTYPYVTKNYIVTRKNDTKDSVNKFKNAIKSEEGIEVLKKLNFITIK